MVNASIKSYTVYFLIVVLSGFLIPSFTISARAQLCVLFICKDAGPENEGLTFTFEESQGQSAIREFELMSGSECHETSFFDADHDLTIIENPTPGFVLDNVVCDGISDNSIIITETNGGIVAQCNGEDEATCTFINVPGSTPTNIPTLSEWGMVAAAAGLGFIGLFFALKRRHCPISNGTWQ